MDHVEALADAIMQFEGWHTNSRSWRNRNPGNLRPYITTQPKDDAGYRIFSSLEDGWRALRTDIIAKIHGSHGLGAGATIQDMINVYAPVGDSNNPNTYAVFVANHLTNALNKNITPTTRLRDLCV